MQCIGLNWEADVLLQAKPTVEHTLDHYTGPWTSRFAAHGLCACAGVCTVPHQPWHATDMQLLDVDE
jgi:hypothetical protein